MITLAQAAAQTGMVRSSILRAIKRGALSGIRNPDGTWLVDLAELPRLPREHSGHPPTRSPRSGRRRQARSCATCPTSATIGAQAQRLR